MAIKAAFISANFSGLAFAKLFCCPMSSFKLYKRGSFEFPTSIFTFRTKYMLPIFADFSIAPGMALGSKQIRVETVWWILGERVLNWDPLSLNTKEIETP